MSSGQIEQEYQALAEREAPVFAAKPQRRESDADAVSSDSFSGTAEASRPSRYVGFGAGLEQRATQDRRMREAALIPQASSSRGVGPTSLSAARMKRVPEERMVPLSQESKSGGRSGAVESPSLGILRGKFVVRDMVSKGEQHPDKIPFKSLEDLPGVLGIEPNLPGSPKSWLKEIIDLFQAGHHRKAEESLRAFHKKYPRFDNFPENFPQELLDKVSAEAGSDERE